MDPSVPFWEPRVKRTVYVLLGERASVELWGSSSPEPCAAAVKENLGKLSMLEKGNKVKTPFGDITVSGRNI